jgi:hypothetical protein
MTRTDEFDDLGNEFHELFAMLSPILEATARPGEYAQGSLWYDIKANPEKYVSTMCELAGLNESLPQLLEMQGVRFQPLPLRHSIHPEFVPFDTGVVGAQILGLSKRANAKIIKNPVEFWPTHFKMQLRGMRPQSGLTFDGFFLTDGVSLRVVKRLDEPKGPRKRKYGIWSLTLYL